MRPTLDQVVSLAKKWLDEDEDHVREHIDTAFYKASHTWKSAPQELRDHYVARVLEAVLLTQPRT